MAWSERVYIPQIGISKSTDRKADPGVRSHYSRLCVRAEFGGDSGRQSANVVRENG